MTQEQTEQLIKELEKLRNEAMSNQKQANCSANESFHCGEVIAYFNAIDLINQTTVNRSSTEPKFIEE